MLVKGEGGLVPSSGDLFYMPSFAMVTNLVTNLVTNPISLITNMVTPITLVTSLSGRTSSATNSGVWQILSGADNQKQ